MQKLPANLLKRGLMVAAALAIVGALAWAMWPKAVGVDFAQVTRGPFLVTVDEEGKTRIKDVYTVSAPIGGKLLRRTLEVGDRVKKDVTPVATIEPSAPPFLDVRTLRELEAQVEAGKAAVALAEAEIRQAESELEFAESELTRARALMRTKTISERAMERARIDVDTRRAVVARAKSNLEVHKRELESGQARLIGPEEAWKGEVPVGCCVTVRAPVSGRVLRLIQESERVVLPGTPLVDIGDPGESRAGGGVSLHRRRQGARGGQGDGGGLGRGAADGQGDARRARRLHQGFRARHRGAARARHPGAAQRR